MSKPKSLSAQRGFILSPHRGGKAATPTPRSPYQLRIVPDGGTPRTLECPRSVQVPLGVMSYASSFACDCGVSGRVEVLELVDGTWKATRVLDVKSSAPTGWREPAPSDI